MEYLDSYIPHWYSKYCYLIFPAVRISAIDFAKEILRPRPHNGFAEIPVCSEFTPISPIILHVEVNALQRNILTMPIFYKKKVPTITSLIYIFWCWWRVFRYFLIYNISTWIIELIFCNSRVSVKTELRCRRSYTFFLQLKYREIGQLKL